MSEWQSGKITDLVKFRTGKLNSNAENRNGKYPFFTCSPETLRIDDYAFDCEALLLAGNNADGNFALKYYAGKFNAYQRTYVITIPDINYLSYKYLFYALRTRLADLKNISAGSATKFLTLSILNDIEIPLPSIEEQKSIASVLSSLDDKIDLLHRQNKTLEAMAETLFRQWFVEEAREDWKTVKIGDFVKTNELTASNSYNHQFIEYLDTSSLTEGKIEEVQLLNFKEAPSRARRIVRQNDILISTVRPNQKHYGIIKSPKKNLVVSTGFCVLTCKKIDPYFIYVLLTTDEMTEYMHSIAEGSTSTYPSLKPSDIEKVEFLLPPKYLLDEFSALAASNWNKIELNYRQISTLEKLRNKLLPKLMSGEVRVSGNG